MTKPAPRRRTWWTMFAMVVNGYVLIEKQSIEVSEETSKVQVHYAPFLVPSMATTHQIITGLTPPNGASSAVIGVCDIEPPLNDANKASQTSLPQAQISNGAKQYSLPDNFFTLAYSSRFFLSHSRAASRQTTTCIHLQRIPNCISLRIATMSAMDMFWAAPPVARYAASSATPHPRPHF